MKIIVAGDVHAEWGVLNAMIARQKPDILLQCGDFGWWPKDKLYPIKIKNGNCEIYWCDGNHEDHASLAKLKTTLVKPNVRYMPRASVLPLPDGRNVLFMGGAFSIDWRRRIDRFNWFREEELINQRDLDLLDYIDRKIDIVVSHTCPKTFMDQKDLFYSYRMIEPCNYALDIVLEKFKPDLWYFGHFHKYATGQYENTKWTALSMARETNWWEELE